MVMHHASGSKDFLLATSIRYKYRRWHTLYATICRRWAPYDIAKFRSALTLLVRVSVSLIFPIFGEHRTPRPFVESWRLFCQFPKGRIGHYSTHSCETRRLCTSRRYPLAPVFPNSRDERKLMSPLINSHLVRRVGLIK